MDTLKAAIAHQLVGLEHATGRFTEQGKSGYVISVCKTCSQPQSVSTATANHAVNVYRYSEEPVIICRQCSYNSPTGKKDTLEDALRTPESQRTAEQQRLVAQHEIDNIVQAPSRQRRAEDNAREQAANAHAECAARRSMFESHERFLTALAHICAVNTINDPHVTSHDDYISWPQWNAMSAEQRAETTRWVDIYFANNGLRWPC
jgi:hypothetical protein